MRTLTVIGGGFIASLFVCKFLFNDSGFPVFLQVIVFVALWVGGSYRLNVLVSGENLSSKNFLTSDKQTEEIFQSPKIKTLLRQYAIFFVITTVYGFINRYIQKHYTMFDPIGDAWGWIGILILLILIFYFFIITIRAFGLNIRVPGYDYSRSGFAQSFATSNPIAGGIVQSVMVIACIGIVVAGVLFAGVNKSIWPLIVSLIIAGAIGFPVRFGWLDSDGIRKSNVQRDKIKEAYGAREMANFSDLNYVCSPTGFYVGASYWHWFEEGHILTLGSTGDGKNTSLILPNLISPAFGATGTSIFCLDPKGENYAVSSDQLRSQGYNVYRLNSTDIFGMGTDNFNLFSMINKDSPDAYAFCKTIAASLCPIKGGNDTSDYFNGRAQTLLTTYMLHMLDREGSNGSFVTLYDWVMLGEDKRVGKLMEMETSTAFEGVVASQASGILSGFNMGGSREASGVYTSAENALSAFMNPQTRKVVRQSNFTLTELIDHPTALFINIPFGELKGSAGWVRAMIGILSRLMETRHNRDRRLLFMLDEFTRLGHVSEVEEGFVTLRSFGVTYHIVVQDMQQLKKSYPGTEKSFFSSAAVINALRVKDYDMAKILSDMTGKDVNVVSMGENHAPHVVHKQVVTPDEFQNNDDHYLFLNGMPNVIKLPKLSYFNNPKLKGLWRQNPLYRRSHQP